MALASPALLDHLRVMQHTIEAPRTGGIMRTVSADGALHFRDDVYGLDEVGGGAAVSELFAFVPTPAMFRHYSDILREKFQLRQMIGALAGGIGSAASSALI